MLRISAPGGSHVRHDFEVEVADGVDLEDVDQAGAELVVDDVAVDGFDAVLAELLRVVG